MKSLKEDGVLKFPEIDPSVELAEEDLLITMTQQEGYVTQNDNGITVVMDTNLSEELLEEGFARELISKIQTMRKEADFEVMDHIEISYEGSDKIKTIFDKQGAFIAGETLADGLVAGLNDGYRKAWNINGEDVTLAVKKL